MLGKPVFELIFALYYVNKVVERKGGGKGRRRTYSNDGIYLTYSWLGEKRGGCAATATGTCHERNFIVWRWRRTVCTVLCCEFKRGGGILP